MLTAMALDDVTFSYASTPVLKGVTVAARPGECVALMGPSGCGKSTLLLLAAGILAAEGGTVTVCGQDLTGLDAERRAAVRRSAIGLVFQFGELVAELSLRENVALAAELAGIRRRPALSEASRLLEAVGLAEVSDRLPGQVSGGQAQRAAVARAVVHRPGLVLADEPTGALDSANARVVLGLLMRMAVEIGAAVVIATHDRDVAERCDRMVRLRDGAVASQGAQVAG